MKSRVQLYHYLGRVRKGRPGLEHEDQGMMMNVKVTG